MTKTSKVAEKKATARIERGSGNVFADLQLPDPEGRLAKAELARQISMLIESAGLTQTEAAQRLGIDQPKVSALMRGRLKDFSTDRLLRFITALDRDVLIVIRNPKNKRRAGVTISVEA